MSQAEKSTARQFVLTNTHLAAYGTKWDYIGRDDFTFLQEMAELNEKLDGAALDTLHAIYTCGPLDDGDVPSKRGRDFLVEHELAARITIKGEDGYNACTHYGARLYRFHKRLRELKEKEAAVTPVVPHHPV